MLYYNSMYDSLEGVNMKSVVNVGDTVYVVPVGNMMRGREGTPFDHIKEHKVEKVGRKYIYLKGNSRTKYGLDCGNIRDISEYSADYELYLTKEDIQLVFETTRLRNEFDRVKSNFDDMTMADRELVNSILKKYRKE